MREPKVLVKLHGGLGNNMFRFATFESFKYTYPEYYSQIAYTGYPNCNLANSYFKANSLDIYKNTIYSKIKGNFDYQSKIDRKSIQEYEPDHFETLDFIKNEKENLLIDGWYQNHNLFTNKWFVKGLFDLSKIPLQEDMIQVLNTKKCVSLHVRRGDYLAIPGVLPLLSVDYYQQALNIIGEYDHLFIFSDDIEWCRANFNFNNMTFISADELTSLKIMTLCSHHIICNSSFSWWGAYLSNSQKVIMPFNWEGPDVKNPRPIRHYQLDDWIAI